MKRKLIRTGIITLIIVEALVSLMMTKEVLVLPTLGLMLVVGLLVRDRDDWGFYTFIAALPLVVTTGELSLPAGGITLVTTLSLLFLDCCQYWNGKDLAVVTILVLVIVSAAIVSPFIGGVTGLAGIALFIALAGSALALFRNRLLIRKYRGDT
ncbi:MAG: hypothetical protein NTV68_16245 [Methanomicrobiales archaeon]|nr:hypothetical protein [Methanomicrobiales archaeon]